jgi:hypothetical protein
MTLIRAEATSEVDATPEAVYAVLADYQTAHPAILPKPYFTSLTVEQGGHGAGTVARVGMEVMGVRQNYRLVVTEPEPGRCLAEADEAAGLSTVFAVEPLDDGRRSRVTIATQSPASPGLKGVMERLVTPPITRRIFRQELQNLADYLRQPRSF